MYLSNNIRLGTLLVVVNVNPASQPSFSSHILKALVLFQDIDSQLHIKCIGQQFN